MQQKGLKELGILRGVGSSSYHKLNPTSIGSYVLKSAWRSVQYV